MDSEKTIYSAKGFWKYICKVGGLDEKYYDKDLIDDLKIELGGKKSDSICKILTVNNISIEKMLSKFFKVTRPFSEMMNDLLSMFEEANTYTTDNNLKIEFDFSTEEKFSFDINHFKTMKEKMNKIEREFNYLNFTTNIVWKLFEPFREYENSHSSIDNIKVNEWINEYNENKWPQIVVECPKFEYPELDKYILRLWTIWEIYIEEVKKICENPNDWKEKIHKHEYHEIKDLLVCQSDKWPRYFIIQIYQFIQYLDSQNITKREQVAEAVTNKLKEIISTIPVLTYTKEEIVKSIEEFLELPIWKHRYELYSAWVCTQIIGSLKEYNIEYIVNNGKLSFSFGGSHIASVVNSNPKLQIWAELRTEWKNNFAKERKSRGKHIQPDYSIVVDPIDQIESTLVVVECKQYKKPSRKNFSEALEDYAEGRPKSNVILVNYGNISKILINEMETDNKNRMFAFGKFIPKSADIIDFKNRIKTTVDQYFNLPDKNIGGELLEEPIKITLEWNKKPRDLDLHLAIDGGKDNTSIDISYENFGDMEKYPFCRYTQDIQSGYGPEEITISKWFDKSYTVSVYNYSNEVDLYESCACIKIKQGLKEKLISITNTGRIIGKTWEVGMIRIGKNGFIIN